MVWENRNRDAGTLAISLSGICQQENRQEKYRTHQGVQAIIQGKTHGFNTSGSCQNRHPKLVQIYPIIAGSQEENDSNRQLRPGAFGKFKTI
jgi:hypothetical protein